MKRILVIGGGGAKGLIPITVCKYIEHVLNKPIWEIFDLIAGSSVGAVEGGILSSGTVSAAKFQDVMYHRLDDVFDRRLRWPIFQPKYSRKPLEKILDEYVCMLPMSGCKTRFMCTSVNMVDGRTHFFKSWEEKDGKMLIKDSVLRSAAAPLFFGSIVDKKDKGVWLDGGAGNMNNPVMEAVIEGMRQGWLFNEHVHILSIGCGIHDQGVPFRKASHYKNLRQIKFYSQIVEGGLARAQMTRSLTEWLTAMAMQPKMNMTYQSLEDWDMPKKMDKMDALKYKDDYVRIGEELANQVDYTPLR